MTKSVDERLFEQLMRVPHAIRRNLFENKFGGPCHDGRPPFPPMGGPRHGHMFMRERLLGIIAGYEGGVRQKTLTEKLRINPSSISESISKLQNDGYVKRTVDPGDKRATLIVLTELGEARAAELADERQARFAGLFSALTEEEKEQLAALLGKLTVETKGE